MVKKLENKRQWFRRRVICSTDGAHMCQNQCAIKVKEAFSDEETEFIGILVKINLSLSA